MSKVNQKLAEVGKDKRYKLTPLKIAEIRELKGVKRAKDIALDYGITRQRVSQIWLPEERRLEIAKRDSKKYLERYRNDPNYRQIIYERKKRTAEHRKEVFGSTKG